MRRYADEARELPGCQLFEFRDVRQDGRSQDVADAFDFFHAVEFLAYGFVALDRFFDQALGCFELFFEECALLVQCGEGEGRSVFLLGFCFGDVVEELTAQVDEFAQAGQVGLKHACADAVDVLRETAKKTCIDFICFGEDAVRLCEGTDFTGHDDAHADAFLQEHAHDALFITAGGLAYDEGFMQLFALIDELASARFVVREGSVGVVGQ